MFALKVCNHEYFITSLIVIITDVGIQPCLPNRVVFAELCMLLSLDVITHVQVVSKARTMDRAETA